MSEVSTRDEVETILDREQCQSILGIADTSSTAQKCPIVREHVDRQLRFRL